MSIVDLFQWSRKQQFEKAVTPFLTVLYQRAYRLTLSQHDAEDLVQELIANTYSKKIDLAEIDHLQTWLLRSLYYLFVDSWRKANRTPVDQSDWLDEQHHPDTSPSDPFSKTSSHETLNRLIQALDELSREYRVVIVLHDMEGHTLTHISRELEVPLGTLKSRLHRGRKQLREILTDVQPFPEQSRVNP